MSLLSPRLQLKVAQKQILSPGLVQMVSMLQMTRLELKDLINQEIAENPVLDEAAEGEEITPQELQTLLEAERLGTPADEGFLETLDSPEKLAQAEDRAEAEAESPRNSSDFSDSSLAGAVSAGAAEISANEANLSASVDNTGDTVSDTPKDADPFDEIDFGSFFDDYLDPGFKSPAAENPEKPSFETFLSAPETLNDHLEGQLSLLVSSDPIRDAAFSILGNLDENGYLTLTLEELAENEGHEPAALESALKLVQSLDPLGVGARDVRECLLIQLEARGADEGVAGQIVRDHLKLLETKQFKEIAKVLGRPIEHVQIAVDVIRHLDPRPGLRYSGAGATKVEPDVYISKDGEDWLIELNDDDIPQLRLNSQYRKMLDKGQTQEQDKEVRNYVKERFQSALLLMKNIEQRKQTIMKVCQSVVRRQGDFLDHGIDQLKPMMLKELAEEIGVHPSTVSRAVAGKYAHTPQGVFELRYFFSEAVQGSAGAQTPLLLLKRRVKKMIEEEDTRHPLTDDQITAMLKEEGIDVTRRTVAKYREDMKIPSTHQRRQRA